MGKTKIEWLKSADGKPGYTINPVKGLCPVACSYCYARRMYKRFKWNPQIRYPTGLFPYYPPGSKVFIGSTMELFGEWVRPDWMQNILTGCLSNRMSTFIFLTKRPQNLVKWSPFPPNCWVGVSAVDKLHFYAACWHLAGIKAAVKFISFEPLQGSMAGAEPIAEHLQNSGISWVIIGQQTPVSAKTLPHITWVQEIIKAANQAKIPVFLKNNLDGFLPFKQFDEPWTEVYKLRQEFPRVI